MAALYEKDLRINISNVLISNTTDVKMLGVAIDNNLNFNIHSTTLCKMAAQKLHALARVSNFVSLKEFLLPNNSGIIPLNVSAAVDRLTTTPIYWTIIFECKP